MAENLKAKIDLEIDDTGVRGAIKLLDQMQKGLMEGQKLIMDAQKEGVREFRSMQQAIHGIDKAHSRLISGMKGNDSLARIMEQNQRSLKDFSKQFATQMEKMGQLEKDRQQAAAQGNSDLYEAKTKEMKTFLERFAKEQEAHIDRAAEINSKVKEVFQDGRSELSEFMRKDLPKEVGESFGSSIASALSHDTGGILGAFAGIVGSGLEVGTRKFAQRRKERALADEIAGRAPRQGIGSRISAGVQRVPGGKAAAGAMGGIARALGSFVAMMGPIAMAAGGLAAVIKLLVDSESQAIDLNKALLGTVSVTRLGAGNIELANQRMEELRESATDFGTNMRLGLDPAQHMEVLTAIEEHHAGLNTLAKGYESFGAMATDVVTTVRMASLNMATDMQSVSQYIGSMVDGHARELPRIQEELTLVSGAAASADMNSKDFFTTLSQLSGSMSLYNYRVEESAFLLAEMSKHMDAETAKEFTVAMTSGLKDMNAQDRIKASIMAGQGRTQELLTKAVERQFEAVTKMQGGYDGINQALNAMGVASVSSSSELAETMEYLKKTGEYSQFLAQAQTSLSNEQRRALSQASDMAEATRKGGVHVADALANLGTLDSMEVQIAGLENIFATSIDQLPLAFAEQVGLNEKQLMAMREISRVGDGNLKVLQGMAEDGMTSEDIQAWAKDRGMDITLKDGQLIDTNTGEAIKDQYDVIRAMSEEEKQTIMDSADKQESAAERQVKATQSVADILKYMIYDVLNSIFKYVAMVTSFVASIPGIRDSEAAKEARGQALVAGQRNVVGDLDQQLAAAKRGDDPVAVTNLQNQLDLAKARLRDYEAGRFGAAEGEIHSRSDEAKAKRLQGSSEEVDASIQDMKTAVTEGIYRLLNYSEETFETDEQIAEGIEGVLAKIAEDQDLSIHTVRALSQEIAERMVREHKKQKDFETAQKALMTQMMMSPELASHYAATALHGGLINNSTGQQVSETLRRAGLVLPSSAGDARILTGGFAPHLFEPGDMVIKKDEIARTVAGRAGQFVPELLNRMQSGGSTSQTLAPVFNIYGGDVNRVRDEILRMLEMVERKRSGGGI